MRQIVKMKRVRGFGERILVWLCCGVGGDVGEVRGRRGGGVLGEIERERGRRMPMVHVLIFRIFG